MLIVMEIQTEDDCDDGSFSIWNNERDKDCDGNLDYIVSTGTYHTCGMKSDGTVTCWGSIHMVNHLLQMSLLLILVLGMIIRVES